MSVDNKTVKNIAHLARLELPEADTERYREELNSILELIDQLQEVDTDGITGMAHPLANIQPLRHDEITENNQREHLQTTAPAIEDGLFLVPQVIE